MPILDIQRRIREVGRIRLGVKAESASGNTFPKALEKPRFTSRDRTVIEAVAELFGGEVKPWRNGDVDEWEVTVEARSIPIALPPDVESMAYTQWYEQWGGKAGAGLCTKRCDGEHDTIADEPCTCDPENRICKATTRLSVLLPDVPGLGLWRIESHGYYAASELGAAVALITAMAGRGSIIPARLRIDRREVRRLINGKPEVRKFIVPVIDLDVSIKGVQALVAGTPSATPVSIGNGDAPAVEQGWKPVAEIEAPAVLSVPEQLAELDRPPKPPRKGTTRLKPTGNAPRTAAQAKEGQVCSVCAKALTGEPVVKNPGEGSRFIHKSCAGGQQAPAPEGGGGETLPPDPPPPVSPSPAPAPKGRGVSHEQLKNIMRLGSDLFPVNPGEMTGEQARAYRRGQVLGICRALGSPPYDSRNDMDRATATVLIDTLEAIVAGEVSWDGERLVRTESGEIIGFEATGPVANA